MRRDAAELFGAVRQIKEEIFKGFSDQKSQKRK